MKTVEAWIPDTGLDVSEAVVLTYPTREAAIEGSHIDACGAIKVTFEYVDEQPVDENQLNIEGI